MTIPAARLTEPHICAHGGGPITAGSPNVKFGGLAAARVDDPAACPSAPDYIANGAATVLINWLPAGRFSDSTFHGGVVLGGLPTLLIGGASTNNWTIPGLLAVLSAKDKALAERIRSGNIQLEVLRRLHYEDPYYDGSKWTTRTFEAGGQNTPGHITVTSTGSNEEAATTLFHESTHQDQPAGMPWSQREYDAYGKTEDWAIDRGLPSQGTDFRKVDSSGRTVKDTDAIKRAVDADYPISSAPSTIPGASPSTRPDTVINNNPSNGKTVVERADGSTYERPPRAGDTFPGAPIKDGARTVDPSMFRYP